MMKETESLATAKVLLNEVLPVKGIDQWHTETPMLGALPDFDSMTMVTLITLVEERLGVFVSDADIKADDFMTLGAFAQWIQRLKQ